MKNESASQDQPASPNQSVGPPPAIRILLVDDHAILRAGLRAFLEAEDDFRVVAEAEDGNEAVALYKLHQPDITLMDLRLPGKTGLAATKEILESDPQGRIIVVSTYEGDGYIYGALEAGAWAYLLKDLLRTELTHAIRTVHNGKRLLASDSAVKLADGLLRLSLTGRELQVLELVSKGLRNREIAAIISTTEGTVKMHLKHILKKLDATDRTEAVTIAAQRGYLTL